MTPTFSKIIAGTMTWGVWGKKCSSNQMIELMQTCIDTEITSFDHADIYGGYTTENEFGTAFLQSKIDREKIQLISKCGIKILSDNRPHRIKHYNYSARSIIESVEQSLKNLKTDYLDLLLLHRPSPLMESEEIAEAVFQLKKEHKILDFGVSNFTPSQIDLLETKTKISCNQIEFSITHLEPMLDGSLDQLQTKGIQPMCWSPLGTVFRVDDPRNQRILEQATALSLKYDVTTDLILLAWILKHPAKIHPVCGTTDLVRMANLMQATTLYLELEEWFALWSASTGNDVP